MLTPLELIDRSARSLEIQQILDHIGVESALPRLSGALRPPPRTHRYRYYRALAPNSPLRSAVMAMMGSLLKNDCHENVTKFLNNWIL